MVRQKMKAKKAKLNSSKSDKHNSNGLVSSRRRRPKMFVSGVEVQETSQGDDQDDDTMQCVPEISTPPSSSLETYKPKKAQRPRFKTTPKRKEGRNGEKNMRQELDTSEEESDEDELKKKKKEGSWVQCSKTDCLKWRKLPDNVEPITMPERWVCPMNSDQSRMDCAASQETCDSQMDYDVVYTPFVAGSIVWAKVPGYPWWPGMVDDDPDYNCCYEIDDSEVNAISYHVSFIFDKDVSRSWVSYLSIKSFIGTDDPNQTNSRMKKPSKALTKAKALARKVVDLPYKERLKKYSFRVLYKGPIRKTETDHTDSYSDSQGSRSNSKKQHRKTMVKKQREALFEKLEKADKTPTSSTKRLGNESEGPDQNTGSEVVKSKKKKKRVLFSSDEDDGDGQDKNSSKTDFSNEESTEKKLVKKKDSTKKKKTSVEGKSGQHGTPENVSQMRVCDMEKRVEMLENCLNKKDSGKKKTQKAKKRSSDVSSVCQDERGKVDKNGVSKKKEGKRKLSEEEIEAIVQKLKRARQLEEDDGEREEEVQESSERSKSRDIEEMGEKGKNQLDIEQEKGNDKSEELEQEKEKSGNRDIGEEREKGESQNLGAKKEGGKSHDLGEKKEMGKSRHSEEKKVPKEDRKSNEVTKSSEGHTKSSKKSGSTTSEGSSGVADKIKSLPKKSKQVSSELGKEGKRSSLQNRKAASNGDKQKMKKIKKSHFVIPSLEKRTSNSGREVENMEDDVKEVQELVKIDDSGSWKKIKSTSMSENKNTKSAFRKFKAPVKTSHDKVTLKATSHTGGKSSGTTHKSTMSPCAIHKTTMSPGSNHRGTMSPGSTHRSTMSPGTIHRSTISPGSTHRSTMSPGSTNRSTMSPGTTHKITMSPGATHRCSMSPGCTHRCTMSPGTYCQNAAEDLDCYVSIGTLEKDINNLYQELAESEPASNFLQRGPAEDPEQDCVTVEFLDDELTMNNERNENSPLQNRIGTESPEF